MDKELTHRLMLLALNSMTAPTQYEFCERFAALIAEECAKIAEDHPAVSSAVEAQAVAIAIRWKFVK